MEKKSEKMQNKNACEKNTKQNDESWAEGRILCIFLILGGGLLARGRGPGDPLGPRENLEILKKCCKGWQIWGLRKRGPLYSTSSV